jgi:fructose-bisphosphate aldolase class II
VAPDTLELTGHAVLLDTTMPLVSMRELLDHAATNGYGIPAFNVNNLEQVQAVMAAADEVGAPVILQASAGARKYAGEPSSST